MFPGKPPYLNMTTVMTLPVINLKMIYADFDHDDWCWLFRRTWLEINFKMRYYCSDNEITRIMVLTTWRRWQYFQAHMAGFVFEDERWWDHAHCGYNITTGMGMTMLIIQAHMAGFLHQLGGSSSGTYRCALLGHHDNGNLHDAVYYIN